MSDTKENTTNQSDTRQNDDTSKSAPNIEEVLADLRSTIRRFDLHNDSLIDRDVSLVYIDRHQVHNHFLDANEKVNVRSIGETQRQKIGELVVNPISKWEIDRVEFVFQEPLRFVEAKKRLFEHGILILEGAKGTGKRAASIKLLASISDNKSKLNTSVKEQEAFYELNPNIQTKDIVPNGLPQNSAFLLEATGVNALDGINNFHLNALRAALSPKRYFNGFIITVDKLPADFPVEQNNLVCKWDASWAEDLITTQRYILLKHLRFLIHVEGQDTKNFDEVLDVGSVCISGDDVTTILSQPLALEQFAELADLLLPVVYGEKNVVSALAPFSQKANHEVERWFNEGNDEELENLLISAAVFNGVTYDAVSTAAERLAQISISDDDNLESDVALQSRGGRFNKNTTRYERVKQICAKIVSSTYDVHYGKTIQDAIQLENPGWQEAVLRYIWQFDDFRSVILRWLEEYINHPQPLLSAKASAAVGALASYSFYTIESQLLRKWAGSDNERYRRGAALILGITIWDEVYSAESIRLLHYWSSQSGNTAYQWTAANSYAGLAGARYPQQAINDLQLIAASTSRAPILFEPLFQAALSIYSMASRTPEVRQTFVDALVSWYQAESELRVLKQVQRVKSSQRAALLVFWTMFWPARKDPVWRSLLRDCSLPGFTRSQVVKLIRASLNFRQPKNSTRDGLHPRIMAREGLGELIVYTKREKDLELSDALEGILQELRSVCEENYDELDRIQYYAKEWKLANEEAPEFVAILI